MNRSKSTNPSHGHTSCCSCRVVCCVVFLLLCVCACGLFLFLPIGCEQNRDIGVNRTCFSSYPSAVNRKRHRCEQKQIGESFPRPRFVFFCRVVWCLVLFVLCVCVCDMFLFLPIGCEQKRDIGVNRRNSTNLLHGRASCCSCRVVCCVVLFVLCVCVCDLFLFLPIGCEQKREISVNRSKSTNPSHGRVNLTTG